MGDIISKQCDNCQTIKKEVNGWWVIVKHSDENIEFMSMHMFDTNESKGKKSIFACNYVKAYACGQKCLIEKLGKIVSKVGVENVPRNKTTTDGFNKAEESTILPN